MAWQATFDVIPSWPFCLLLLELKYTSSLSCRRFCEIFWENRTAGHLVFWKPWPAVELKKVIRPCQGGSHVARLNFKMSRVVVYKCLSLIVSFAVTVAIWPREVVSCGDFILRAVATFWAMSLVGIYPGRAWSYKCRKTWFRPLSPA